jgi:ATP-dependent HslUV protease subunit HslV
MSQALHGTTILCVKKNNKVIIGADGQVSLGNTILKGTAKKLRTLNNNKIIAGFAGSTADALTLFERLESKLEKYSNQLARSCVELAKDWRCDKYLRKLEAMLIVADAKNMFILTGNGDVLDPEENIAAIGSGGNYARAAAMALIDREDLSAKDIVEKSMNIASRICVFSNSNIIFEEVSE